MASSSSNSSWKYDVFLSFRGADTRKTFTDHLYTALTREGIHTFRDANEICDGEEIGPECLKAIEESRFSIVILSRGYASSTWCLDELVHILQCRKLFGHVVWPVFYNVDPSDVEEIAGSFKEAFLAHEELFKEEIHKVERWKAALKEIAYLKGLDLQRNADGHEAENVDYIVKEISERLDRRMLSVATHPVGLDSSAGEVISLLGNKSSDFGMVGLIGTGGIGKTTLAKEVYNSVYHNFESSCFLGDVRQLSLSKGTTHLQRLLLSTVLKRKHEKIDNVDRGLNVIRERLCRIRVLIVLDDVDRLDQLTKILGNFDWLYRGSRVIVTTRIKDLIRAPELYQQYEVKPLKYSDSLRLLSLHAFNYHHPAEEYMDCAERVIKVAGGIPLALQVLGSSLHGQDVEVWNNRLDKLKVIANEDIHGILKISYDSLDDTEKFLFLDIACFFVGNDKDYVMSILDDCGFFPMDGINTLMRRCLVNVGSHNKLLMHDLIRDMGREIVRRESPTDPGERSRLWRYEDSIDVLTTKSGTKKIEGLVLDILGSEHSLNAKVFKKLKRLRLLQLNRVHLSGSYEHISCKLKWLRWHEFALESMPFDLDLQNLVALDMRYSRLKLLSDEVKSLRKLKFLNLSHSHELIRILNFKGFPNLEKLVLKDCIRLAEVHESIGLLAHLRSLSCQDCKSLKNLPESICLLKSLEKLNVSGCSQLEELPEDLGNLKSLVVLLADETAITTLSKTIEDLKNLKILSLCGCRLMFLPRKHPYITNFLPTSLKKLNLRYCNIVDDAIPHDLQGLALLDDLKLCGNNFVRLPVSICSLPMLRTLWLNECRRLICIPELQPGLLSLHTKECPLLESINLRNFVWNVGSDLEFDACRSLKEIKGFFNIEPLRVETVEKLLETIGSSLNQESIASTNMQMIDNLTGTCRISPLQALCEKGIYSIFLPGSKIPKWFSHQNEGDYVSFHVPPVNKGSKIVGLVTYFIYAWEKHFESCIFVPNITVINRTKMFNWLYNPFITFFLSEAEQDIMWLCCWMFDAHMQNREKGVDMSWKFKDEMEEGDLIEFSIDMGFGIVVKNCGIDLLYHGSDQSSQSNYHVATSICQYASDRHFKRFQESRPRRLIMDQDHKILSEQWTPPKPHHPDMNYIRWSKKRALKINQMPDVF